MKDGGQEAACSRQQSAISTETDGGGETGDGRPETGRLGEDLQAGEGVVVEVHPDGLRQERAINRAIDVMPQWLIQEKIRGDEATLDRIHGEASLLKRGEAKQDSIPGLPKDHTTRN